MAFSIWGLIYVWLLVSAGYGLFARAEAADWDAPRWPLTGSLVVGAAWLAVAQTSAVWASLLIWLMLVLALVALFRTPVRDAWLLRMPIALYAGWLSAACWVSVGLLGAGYGVVMGEFGWAVAGLCGALATAALVLWQMPPVPTYAAAVVWALVGVAVANFGEAWSLVALALGGAALLAGLALRRSLAR